MKYCLLLLLLMAFQAVYATYSRNELVGSDDFNYVLFTWKGSGSITFTATVNAQVLVVGGGGGGGSGGSLEYIFNWCPFSGGGGGAGAVGVGSLTFEAGMYSVNVGNGGPPPNSGSSSSILIGNEIVVNAPGGGGGEGTAGGSGGGAEFVPCLGVPLYGGSSQSGTGSLKWLGNNGESPTNNFGGGGGGAGGAGVGATGGSGYSWPLFSFSGNYFGAGGHGGSGTMSNVPSDATGYGCGGDGAGYSQTSTNFGGRGSDGVVFIAVKKYCPAGEYFSDIYCLLCTAGKYSSAGSFNCTTCPAGKYSSSGSPSCTICPGGKYSSADSSSCSTCPVGKYSSAGSIGCNSCPIGSFYTPPGSSNCGCSPSLQSSSLIALLFQSDSTLRTFSSTFSNNSLIYDISQYLSDILTIELDINGDGTISRSEITAALQYRSITSISLALLPVWNNSVDSVLVTTVFSDAMFSFVNSGKHSFDGSGINYLRSISATFPNASWDPYLCAKYDSFLHRTNFSRTNVTWSYNQPQAKLFSVDGLTQICGYVNGRLVNKFASMLNLNDGLLTNFVDDGNDTDLSFKRVYCLFVLYSDQRTQYECAVGLFYDGTPIDLKPSLTTDGVIFQYLDTSSTEKEFDIFSGYYNSSDDSKKLVVGIPYPSKGCGRTTSHISFADKTVINSVGQIVEYSIKSIQSSDNGHTYVYSNSSSKPYRIPFLSRITGTVKTQSRVGVQGVTVSLCHIDANTAANDQNPSYCPLLSVTTDARGVFDTEIRVSDIAWTRLEEHFNVTAYFTEVLTDGSGQTIKHIFAPASQVVSLRQVLTTSIAFTDLTAVSIIGSVRFDPGNTKGYDCVFPGVPVVLVHGNGIVENTTSSADGSFNFSISKGDKVYLYIPDFKGYSWNSHVESSALLVSNVSSAASVAPSSAPIQTQEYLGTSEWPQNTGQGAGLYDYNWILTTINGNAVNFPAKILPSQVITSPNAHQSAGVYNFRTVFDLPNYADYRCLIIPLDVVGSTSISYINLNSFMNFVQSTSSNISLNGFQSSNNVLDIGVYYGGSGSGVKLSASFSTPIRQCPKVSPVATGGSGGAVDYSWIVSSAADRRKVPYFASVLQTVPAGWYLPPATASGNWITTSNSSKDTAGVYTYQTSFALPTYLNYSCVELSIEITSDYIVNSIVLNGNELANQTFRSIAFNVPISLSLQPYLRKTNVLSVSVINSKYGGFLLTFGDLKTNQCVMYWPQATGISTSDSSDNNWMIESTSFVGQAVVASSILSSWIPESNQAKWIGRSQSTIVGADQPNNYTFVTHFKLAGFDNLQCLQLSMNVSTSCAVIAIVLNENVLLNCSSPAYCGITADEFTSVTLSQYFAPFNTLKIFVRNFGNAPTGLLVDFSSSSVNNLCLNKLPEPTGYGAVVGDLDNNWEVKTSFDAAAELGKVFPSPFNWHSNGANWIKAAATNPVQSAGSDVEIVYRSSFSLPSFFKYGCLKLSFLLGVYGRLNRIVLNGHTIDFQVTTPSLAPTNVPTYLPSSLPTFEPTNLPTTPTAAPTFQPSYAPSFSPSSSPTIIPSSLLPSDSPTFFPSVLPTFQPSCGPSSEPSDAPSFLPSAEPTSLPSDHPTYIPSREPSFMPSYSPTTDPSFLPSSEPSAGPSYFPSPNPTIEPSSTPSWIPTQVPSAIPSITPSEVPTTLPTTEPSALPTSIPTISPSAVPSTTPSALPTIAPTSVPSSLPTAIPTKAPSTKPSTTPTSQPTAAPTTVPSDLPSVIPTIVPSMVPSTAPTTQPKAMPTAVPSALPSLVPTIVASVIPSTAPSALPTVTPTVIPSLVPSTAPSMGPSAVPSSTPSAGSTNKPTYLPSTVSTTVPSSIPSVRPILPSVIPSAIPSMAPSGGPTQLPSVGPSSVPSVGPTSVPSVGPTSVPSIRPSVIPSSSPSTSPTANPILLSSSSANPISLSPTNKPSNLPTLTPSSSTPPISPSFTSSNLPSSSSKPILPPSFNPTIGPTLRATAGPSDIPSNKPSFVPSRIPFTARRRSSETSAEIITKRNLLSSGVNIAQVSTTLPTLSPTYPSQYELQLFFNFTANEIVGTKIRNWISGILSATVVNGGLVGDSQLTLASGLSQYVSIDSFTVSSLGLSFAFWFKSENSGTNARIVDFGNGFGIDNFLIISNANGGNGLWLIFGNGQTWYDWKYSNYNVNNNIWHHLVWVLDPVGSWTVYFDGARIAQLQIPYPNTAATSLNYIGKSIDASVPYFNGSIADFRIYNRVLDFTEIVPLKDFGAPFGARSPSAVPTTTTPSFRPSVQPLIPSQTPTSFQPSTVPTVFPSNSLKPSMNPSVSPSTSTRPTVIPSGIPSSFMPTYTPSQGPSVSPSFGLSFTHYGEYNVTIPAGVYSIYVVLTGASGAGDTLNSASDTGGYGATVTAVLSVIPNQVLHLFVGQAGLASGVATFNGGGYGGVGARGGSGGGGTDIRTSMRLQSRVVVAGGGGGGQYIAPVNIAGGNGGTPNGSPPPSVSNPTGCSLWTFPSGGTQSSGGAGGLCLYQGVAAAGSAGSLGQGGSALNGHSTGVSGYYGGGGGGGYYGGGAGNANAGAGGSSFCDGIICTSPTYTVASGYGDGSIFIYPAPTSLPTSAPSSSTPSNSGVPTSFPSYSKSPSTLPTTEPSVRPISGAPSLAPLSTIIPSGIPSSSYPTFKSSPTPSASPSFGQSFTHYGQYNVTIPAGIYSIFVALTGASGAGDTLHSTSDTGGYGAVVTAALSVSPHQVLHLYVGQAGAASGAATFNGGGQGGGSSGGGGSGGGGTDIRTSFNLKSRVVVAGGGGGGLEYSTTNIIGGNGGTPNGFSPPSLSNPTLCQPWRYPTGGNQTGGGIGGLCLYYGTTTIGGRGSLGQGGSAFNGYPAGTAGYYGGGGGGGYYGGGAGNAHAGAGGSSYCDGIICTSSTYSVANSYGDGSIYIYAAPTSSPTLAPSAILSITPTALPTLSPSNTKSPTAFPTVVPSVEPTTSVPSFVPSSSLPTVIPSDKPSVIPSLAPSFSFVSQQYSLASHNFSSGPFPLVLDFVQEVNTIEIHIESNSTAENALLVNFGAVLADSCLLWPKSTAFSQSFSFDFNWYITSFTNDHTKYSFISYPSVVIAEKRGYIGTPSSLSNIIGLFNFQTSFALPNYANLSCLRIPIHLGSNDSIRYISLNSQSVFDGTSIASELILESYFEPFNILDIGVYSSEGNGTTFSIFFSAPVEQCAIQLPINGLSTELISLTSNAQRFDPNWIVLTDPYSADVPYFPAVLHMVPNGYYIPEDGRSGWISGHYHPSTVKGLYTFQFSFTLAFYSNFSCIDVPISIAAAGEIIEVKLNGHQLPWNLSAIQPNLLSQYILKSIFLTEDDNSLQIIVDATPSNAQLYVSFGAISFDSCIPTWPQATGRDVYSEQLDENWLISATLYSGSAYSTRQAVVATSVPDNWLMNGSLGGKWIGLKSNFSIGDEAGFYTYQTSFIIPQYNNKSSSSLIIPFTIASANSIVTVKLNGQVLYDCSLQNYCGISNSKVVVLFLNQYLASFNALEIISEIPVSSSSENQYPVGLLVEFQGIILPRSTGLSSYDFDLSWLLISAPYVINGESTPAFIVSHPNEHWAVAPGGQWITSSDSLDGVDIVGFFTYQTNFYIGSFTNYSCLALPFNIAAASEVQQIILNGQLVYECCSPPISFSQLVSLTLLTHLQPINTLQIRILNQIHDSTGILVEFGEPIDLCTQTPTVSPSIRPPIWTASPTVPSVTPSRNPTNLPTEFYSSRPTSQPSVSPTFAFVCPVGYSQWETVCVKQASFEIKCPYGYQFNPNKLGCIPATSSPTDSPTLIPSAGPSEEPTTIPTQPSLTPTILPSYLPSAAPSILPSNDPSISLLPSTYPTFDILNFKDPQLLHTYKFNDVFDKGGAPANAQLIDSTSGDFAILGDDTVTVLKGQAIFSYDSAHPHNIPYIILPHDFLGPSEVITVEIWVRYDGTCSSESILFSFGSILFPNSLVLSSNHGSLDVYVAVVYSMLSNPPSSKLYIDGKISDIVPSPGTFYHPTLSFIGSTNQSLPGMVANIDEFRLWSGELPPKVIYSHYLTGVDPSHITLSSFFTIGNITVDFLATSTQLVSVGIFGGSSQIPMFGEETVFTLQASSNSKCNFSTTFTMDPASSSSTQSVPALNYTVTLTTTAKNAPIFSDCGNAQNCICDPSSKSPISYFTETGKLSQDLVITTVDDSVYSVNFTYHSGVCFETNSAQYSTTAGPCFSPSATILKKGQNSTVNLVLLELYPEGNQWVSSANPVTALTDYTVENASIIITDLVSGRKVPQTFNYTNNFTIIPPSVVPVPVGLNYTITAGQPLPSSPYSWSFEVRVERLDSAVNHAVQGSSIPDYSIVDFTWFVPVTGVIPNEVPNYYPVASDPTMIYLVVRDPPGGGSYSTFHAGQSLTFDISVDQLETYNRHANFVSDGDIGANEQIEQSEAPAGFGIIETGADEEDVESANHQGTQTIKYSRGSESHYSVNISFSYDIATSQDPRIAGHLSDVIVGGGIDLIVSEAIQVAANVTASSVCLFAFDTYLWQPGKATTYILPVIEIEDIIKRLMRVRDDLVSNDNNPIIEKLTGDSSATIAQLNKQLDNWNTVLSNYRAHNNDLYSAFNQEQIINNALMQTYQAWQSSIVSNGDLSSFVTSQLTPAGIISSITGSSSGSSSGVISTLSSTSQEFSDLSNSASSLSGGLSSLAASTSSLSRSRSLLMSSRSLQTVSVASVSSTLLSLSDSFGNLADKTESVASSLASLAANPIVKYIAEIFDTLLPSGKSKFNQEFSSIQTKVKQLKNKVDTFAAAAYTSLSNFESQVGDYLSDLQAGLELIANAAPTVASVLDTVANYAQRVSNKLATFLSDISTYITDAGTLASALNNDLTILDQLFPSPTSRLITGLTSTISFVKDFASSSGSFSSALSSVSQSLPSSSSSSRKLVGSRLLGSSTSTLQVVLSDFSSALSFLGSVAGIVSSELSSVSNYARELTPVLSKVTKAFSNAKSKAASTTSSISSKVTALLTSLSSAISKLVTIFKKMTAAATASLESLASSLTALYNNVVSFVNSLVSFISALAAAFQELYNFASAFHVGSFLLPVITDLNKFANATAAIPGYINSLPKLILAELQLSESGFESALLVSVEALSNVSQSAAVFSNSSKSLSSILPAPFSAALSLPMSYISTVTKFVATESKLIARGISSLLSSTGFSTLLDILAGDVIPDSSSLLSEFTALNSKLFFVSTSLTLLNDDIASVSLSRRLTDNSLFSSIESILASLFDTLNQISAELQTVLSGVATIGGDISDTLGGVIPALQSLLPKKLMALLETVQKDLVKLVAIANKLLSALGSLTSPFSAINPYISELLTGLSEVTQAARTISISATELVIYLPSSVSTELSGPLNTLNASCTDLQDVSTLISTSVSLISSSPLLNLLADLFPSSLANAIKSAFTTLAAHATSLGASLSKLVPSFSSSSASSSSSVLGHLSSISSELKSLLPSILSDLSTLSQISVTAQPILSEISQATSSVPVLSSFIAELSLYIQKLSSDANSLAAAASVLSSTLTSLSTIVSSNSSSTHRRDRRHRSLFRANPSTGVLLGLLEETLLTGAGSLGQNVPGYTFGQQSFEGNLPNDWMTFYSTLESECDLPSALDGSTPLAYDAVCQSRSAAQSGDIPGGYRSTGADSLLAFLRDPQKLVTFSANAPVSLSWTSSVTGAVTYSANYEYTADDDSEPVDLTSQTDIEGADGGLKTGSTFNPVAGNLVRVGKHSNNLESHSRTVSVKLSDSDNGDYFAVRITEDPIYATPIFSTLGGQSKCPGETGTSRRESNVQILEIVPRCGPKNNQICDESTLVPGDPALFGVVIQNLSPTEDEVYYTLGLSQRFDSFQRNAYEASGEGFCGTPYQRAGLVVSFSQQDLQRIPYNHLIEVPITVSQGQLCSRFTSIEVQIIATCEIPNSESQVFQYGIVNAVISYLDADKIYALNSTATFSVAWPTSTQRRAQSHLQSQPDEGGEGFGSLAVGDVDKKVAELHAKMNVLVETLTEKDDKMAGLIDTRVEKLTDSIDAKLVALASSMNDKQNFLLVALLGVLVVMSVTIVALVMAAFYLYYRQAVPKDGGDRASGTMASRDV